MASNMVVARFLDGRVVKGSSLDIDPSRPIFHVRKPEGGTEQIALTQLKALFFVRSLAGDWSRGEKLELDPADSRARGSFPIAMRFPDGETIVGLTISYPPARPYFWVVPVDPGSNNIRILVNKAAIVAMDSPPGLVPSPAPPPPART